MNKEKVTKIFVTHFHEINNKNSKTNFKHSFDDKTIHELKPIFFVCRIFGMSPYTISNEKISLSNIGVICSGIFVIYHFYVFFYRAKIYYYDNVDLKLKTLSIIRLLLLTLAICVDIILCIYWDRKMQNSINNTWYYEKMIKFQKKKKYNLVIITWILTIVNVMFFLLMGSLSFFFDNSEGTGALVYVQLYLSMIFGIIKFLLIVIVICRRFQNLNGYLIKGL